MTKARILYAEDDNDVFRATARSLRGHEIIRVRNGKQAIEADKTDISLILMDKTMVPCDGSEDIDGIQAVRIIRDSGYAGPVVLYTAETYLNLEEEAFAAGCNEVLSKLSPLGVLAQKVDFHIMQSQMTHTPPPY
ncbi:response regulator [Candidatus Woesearchaeota archaeon]|nr:response regulator [Candidatus Woesearchaeota archaeon]